MSDHVAIVDASERGEQPAVSAEHAL